MELSKDSVTFDQNLPLADQIESQIVLGMSECKSYREISENIYSLYLSALQYEASNKNN